MTRIASPSRLTVLAVAATSLALGVGLTACVRTVSGPLPRASQPLAPNGGASDGYAGGGYGEYGDGGSG